MDYSKLSEITVHNQEELDAIPDDFKGSIYVDGGKVRTSKLKVLREIPLEECGPYGKILAKRRS